MAEQTAWRAFLSAVQMLNTEVEAQLQRDSGISHADYEILVRLSEQPDRSLRMSELAARAVFSRSRLSHAVARMEREGWVRREPSPEDGRGLAPSSPTAVSTSWPPPRRAMSRPCVPP